MSNNNNQSNLKKVLKNIIHLEDFESQESLYQFVKKNIDTEYWLEMENGDFISTWSNVISKKGKLRKQRLKSADEKYFKIGILEDGKLKNYYTHRLVAKYFVPNPFDKPQVDHIDGDPMNNKVDNLRWVTGEENRNNKISKERFRTYYKTIVGVNDNGDIIEVDYLSDLSESGFTARDIETISKCCDKNKITTREVRENNGVKIIIDTTYDYSEGYYKGYVWNSVDKEGKERYRQHKRHDDKKKEYKPKTKKVIQLTLSGDTVKIWNSAREASEELNISISLIRDCCLGKQKTTKGFIFMYLKDYMGK